MKKWFVPKGHPIRLPSGNVEAGRDPDQKMILYRNDRVKKYYKTIFGGNGWTVEEWDFSELDLADCDAGC